MPSTHGQLVPTWRCAGLGAVFVLSIFQYPRVSAPDYASWRARLSTGTGSAHGHSIVAGTGRGMSGCADELGARPDEVAIMAAVPRGYTAETEQGTRVAAGRINACCT